MLIFIVTYFGVALGLRSIILYKNTKIDTRKVFMNETGTKKSGRLILISMFLMVVVAVNFIWIVPNYRYLFPISYLEIGLVQTVGFVISMLGQVLGFIAQLQMKNSWRLGVDKDGATELVTTGFFSISRNPIYLCLALSFFGFFLLAPNVVSIVFCFIMLYGVNEKISDEEEFLIEKFGTDFVKYRNEVRRWI